MNRVNGRHWMCWRGFDMRKMRLPLAALALLIFLAPGSTERAAADDAADPRARDLLLITDWFEGEFDNEEQLWFHGRSRSEGEPPVRIHVNNARLDLPALGEHVFYTEEYKDNDSKSVYRQRLVTFSSDAEANAIRMRQGFFNDPAAVLGAHHSAEAAAAINADSVSFIDECDVYFRRVADQFHGEMTPKACVFGEGDERRYAVHTIDLSENKFWRTDATYLIADDAYFRGTKPGEPTELRRARSYYCDFYFDATEGAPAQESSGHRVFSQGGSATALREADGQSFDILIREKEYPYYTTRPDFIYYSVRHTGAERSITYGVADPASRQFGSKTNGVGVFCHQDGYEFRERVEDLDHLY